MSPIQFFITGCLLILLPSVSQAKFPSFSDPSAELVVLDDPDEIKTYLPGVSDPEVIENHVFLAWMKKQIDEGNFAVYVRLAHANDAINNRDVPRSPGRQCRCSTAVIRPGRKTVPNTRS